MTDKPWWDKIMHVGDVNIIAWRVENDWVVDIIDSKTGFSKTDGYRIEPKYLREIRDMLEVLIAEC